MSSFDLSEVWPEWKVEGKPLGRGSYGVVYKAVRRDHDVESFAAIKVISIPQNESEIDSLRSEGMSIDATRTYLEGVVSDFVSEIQLMESFKGVQNIVSVEDYKVVEKTDEVGWDIYIRMELLTPFNSYISDKTMSEEEVIKLGVDICTALELCAERNVIHRDIKPQNIFINQFGHFKLGDFGIARKLENVTGGLSQKGSPNYMAPEVAHSTQYDATVDLYSLGIVLYQLMNKNRLPFLDTERQLLNPNERAAALSRRLEGEPLSPPCDASPAMAEVILCASNPDPSKRFASAKAMKNALMSVTNGTYTASEADLNKTMSVRHATQTQDPNRTTSVRKAPQTQKSVQKQVDTLWEKRNQRLPVIIAVVLAVAILVGGGAFVVPRLLGNNDSQDSSVDVVAENNDSSVSVADDKNGVYSAFDEEQIAAAIEEAETLAEDEDYEGALTKIKTALVTYPKSEALQTKETEYTEAIAAQVKAKTLDEAANLAESGDYVSAIALIKNAQETNGEDADYTSAYNAYCASYKEEVIGQADELADGGDYLGAIQKIAEATAVIGSDDNLFSKSQSYENSYVSEIIEQVDECINMKAFDTAKEILNDAKKAFPNNEALKNEQTVLNESITRAENAVKYLGRDITAYNNGLYYKEYDGSSSFNLGGVPYKKGFTIGTYEYGGSANFNLGGNYNYISGVAGNVDGVNYSVAYNVLGDGELIGTIEIQGASLPTAFEFDVSGVRQLTIVATGNDNHAEGVGFGNVAVYSEETDKPVSYEFPNLPTEAYLGADIKAFVSGLYYKEFSGMSTFSMGGEAYSKGFEIGTYAYGGYASFNIGGKYTTLTGVAGNVDGVKYSVSYSVLGDGKPLGTIEVTSGGLPTEFSFDVTGVSQLNFIATGRDNHAEGVGFANVLLK